MGITIHIPDDTLEPYTRAAEGKLDEAKELMIDTLDEHAPEVFDE